MRFLDYLKNNKIEIICLFLYCIITLYRVFTHTPWFDEAHAWTIAEQLNFIDMFNYVKNEGHFFLWQAILYPFAHSHVISYPYPMQILNWLFCTAAIVLMWRKCSLPNWIKVLITFSFPFIGCYGVLARCYSIGILLLFILIAMDENKLKYPKTYAFLLILSANTNVICLFATSALGLMFLYDLVKNKNLKIFDNICISLILLLGSALILYQLLNIGYWDSTVGHRTLHFSVKIFRNTFINDRLLPNLLMLGVFSIFILGYFCKKTKVIFFIGFTYFFFLILCTCVYSVFFWHTYLFYVFLICAFWLMNDKNSNDLFARSAKISLALISLIFIFHTPNMEKFSFIYDGISLKFREYIEQDDILSRARIIQNDGILYEMIPYAGNKTYQLKNYCHEQDNTDYDLWNISTRICPVENAMWQASKFPRVLKNIVNDNTYTYIKKSITKVDEDIVFVKTSGIVFEFNKYKCFEDYCFWKINVK